jgi:hypothetical protein
MLQVRTAIVNGTFDQDHRASAGIAAHFALQHDRPHVWDGLVWEAGNISRATVRPREPMT